MFKVTAAELNEYHERYVYEGKKQGLRLEFSDEAYIAKEGERATKGAHELEGVNELKGVHELMGVNDIEGAHELEHEGVHDLEGVHNNDTFDTPLPIDINNIVLDVHNISHPPNPNTAAYLEQRAIHRQKFLQEVKDLGFATN